jgi:hypothetical protein
MRDAVAGIHRGILASPAAWPPGLLGNQEAGRLGGSEAV